MKHLRPLAVYAGILLIVAACAGFVHYIVNPRLGAWSVTVNFLLGSHLFLLGLGLGAGLLLFILSYRQHALGFGFLSISLLKMFAAIFYLLPYIREESAELPVMVLHFMLLYFLYLMPEVWWGIRLLKKSSR